MSLNLYIFAILIYLIVLCHFRYSKALSSQRDRATLDVTSEHIAECHKNLAKYFKGKSDLKMIEHLYEDLNVLDRKLGQLSAFNAAVLIAGGILFRSLEVVIRAAGEIDRWWATFGLSLFVFTYGFIAVAGLSAAVPGIKFASGGEMNIDGLIRSREKRYQRYWKAVFLTRYALSFVVMCLLFYLLVKLAVIWECD